MARKNPKSILVTGAGSGIGAAIARRVGARGDRVILSDVDLSAIKRIAGEIGANATAIRLDIRSEQEWDSVLDGIWEEFGGLDVLVNNAGVVHPGNAVSVDLPGHQRTMDINFMGPLKGMLAAYPRLRDQGHGQIVTVCSMTSFLPSPGLGSYAASKHALRAFHHSLALEERNGPVRFTIVHPTATETPMLEQEAENDDTALAFAAPSVTPEYVAEVVVDAMDKAKVEVFMPANRGAWIRHVGSSAKLMRQLCEPGLAAGIQALKARRAAKAE